MWTFEHLHLPVHQKSLYGNVVWEGAPSGCEILTTFLNQTFNHLLLYWQFYCWSFHSILMVQWLFSLSHFISYPFIHMFRPYKAIFRYMFCVNYFKRNYIESQRMRSLPSTGRTSVRREHLQQNHTWYSRKRPSALWYSSSRSENKWKSCYYPHQFKNISSILTSINFQFDFVASLNW
jgi:hypothetical protein